MKSPSFDWINAASARRLNRLAEIQAVFENAVVQKIGRLLNSF
jgi:hypothetical protein